MCHSPRCQQGGKHRWLRECHAKDPAYSGASQLFAEAAELGGAKPAAPHKPGGLDQLLDRCWDCALERSLGKGEGGSCPESEEESSAPLGLNFSTLFRRSLKTRSRLDSRAGAGLEPTRSQQLSLTRILWSSS